MSSRGVRKRIVASRPWSWLPRNRENQPSREGQDETRNHQQGAARKTRDTMSALATWKDKSP